MTRIGAVQLGNAPRVVLCANGDSPGVARAAREGIDFIEARVDLFHHLAPASVLSEVRALRRHRVPLIGTVRSASQGGAASITEARRLKLYAKMAPLVGAMDVDLTAGALADILQVARAHKKTLMLSHHDFNGTPSDAALTRIADKAKALGADLIKIAAMANSDRDVVRLLQFTLRHRAKHLVTMAMGSRGSISRLVFPLAGSLLTYTSLTPRHGQVPLARLLEDLKFYYPK